ncbi:MAG: serine hydrolase, partial [Pirellulales bacterium]
MSLLLAAALCCVTPEASPLTGVNEVAGQSLSKLSGHTGFLFCEIEGDAPRELFAVRADERFAIGSSFKLFILGALADEVNADRRALDNVMLLEKQLEGPPHSEMADWPVGSPVTLNTLALKMISISDNTATDHLLYLLGRERVERQMKTMGHAHPEWNTPMLSTRDMVELRNRKTGMLGREYDKLDEAARRKFLAEHF